MTEAPITTTIKFGAGYEAPWSVLRADTPAQAIGQLAALAPSENMNEAVAKNDYALAVALATKHFQGRLSVGDLAAATNAPQPQATQPQAAAPWGGAPAQPQAAQAAPQAQSFGPGASAPSSTPTCKHGQRVHKSGIGKTGKPWEAWMCAAPRGTADACEPDWVR